ncbi:MAG: glycosyltransferase family 4 protein [Limisphaera sp.]|nr:glycosyltransferase family 4 protein [Limisphaera sp.]
MKVAWISYFPVEWMPEAPPEIQRMPKHHPASWQRVLLRRWMEDNPDLELHILALRKQFPRSCQFRIGPATFHCIRTIGGFRAPTLFWYDTWLIARTLRQVRPSLVHAWGTENGAALIAARLRYPYLVTVQGLMSWYREAVPDLPMYHHMAAWLERRSLSRAPLVTTESRFAVEFVRSRFHAPRILQIEHAPDPCFSEIARQPAQGQFRFLANGRFDLRKGADLLLRALHRIAAEIPWQLIHIGPPRSPLADQLRAELGPTLWSRIVFRQQLTPVEVAEELAHATLMLCPTRADVSPNSVKEAVVAGVPVVASRTGGIPDYVVPGKNGLLFEPGDLEGFVAALREACRHPLFKLGKVDTETLHRMREYLSPQVMAHRFHEAYQQLLTLADHSKQQAAHASGEGPTRATQSPT